MLLLTLIPFKRKFLKNIFVVAIINDCLQVNIQDYIRRLINKFQKGNTYYSRGILFTKLFAYSTRFDMNINRYSIIRILYVVTCKVEA